LLPSAPVTPCQLPTLCSRRESDFLAGRSVFEAGLLRPEPGQALHINQKYPEDVLLANYFWFGMLQTQIEVSCLQSQPQLQEPASSARTSGWVGVHTAAASRERSGDPEDFPSVEGDALLPGCRPPRRILPADSLQPLLHWKSKQARSGGAQPKGKEPKLHPTQWVLLRDAPRGEMSIGMCTSPQGTTRQGLTRGDQVTPANPAVPIRPPHHIIRIPSLSLLHSSRSLPSHPPPPPAFGRVFEELSPQKIKGLRMLHSQDLFPSRTRHPGGSRAATIPPARTSIPGDRPWWL